MMMLLDEIKITEALYEFNRTNDKEGFITWYNSLSSLEKGVIAENCRWPMRQMIKIFGDKAEYLRVMLPIFYKDLSEAMGDFSKVVNE